MQIYCDKVVLLYIFIYSLLTFFIIRFLIQTHIYHYCFGSRKESFTKLLQFELIVCQVVKFCYKVSPSSCQGFDRTVQWVSSSFVGRLQ